MNNLPLEGLRVLDMSTVLAAPLTASLLAEFGADVVKVEHPRLGDPVRDFPPFFDGVSLHHKVTNKGKRSLTIDLSKPEGADLARRLVAEFDVVITNFRPSTLRRWGLDYEDLAEAKPDLVMLHLTAFGREGPYAERPGFARIAEALAGLTHVTGYADRPPVFAGYPIADGIAGVHGAFALMLAIAHHRATGEGQLVDLGLYESLLRMMEDLVVGAAETGEDKQRCGNEQANVCPNGMFPTADGEFVIIPASTQRMWERLIDLLGAEQLRPYSTNAIRLAHRREIEDAIAAFTAQHTLDALMEMFEIHGIACGKLFSASDIIADPHVRARGNLVEVYDDELDRTLTMQAPMPRFSAFTGRPGRPGRALGADTAEVLGALLGMDAEGLADLRGRHVI